MKHIIKNIMEDRQESFGFMSNGIVEGSLTSSNLMDYLEGRTRLVPEIRRVAHRVIERNRDKLLVPKYHWSISLSFEGFYISVLLGCFVLGHKIDAYVGFKPCSLFPIYFSSYSYSTGMPDTVYILGDSELSGKLEEVYKQPWYGGQIKLVTKDVLIDKYKGWIRVSGWNNIL